MLLGLIVMWALVVLSALVDNVPVTIAMIGHQPGARHRHQPIWRAVALGTGIGGNATPIGSTANVVVIAISERTDHPPTAMAIRRHLTVIVATLASALYAPVRFPERGLRSRPVALAALISVSGDRLMRGSASCRLSADRAGAGRSMLERQQQA